LASNDPSAYYCYLLSCSDGSLYCGWTTDLKKRLAMHNKGKGARYTRARLPVGLVYSEELPNRSSALCREWEIKKMTHTEKLALTKDYERKRV